MSWGFGRTTYAAGNYSTKAEAEQAGKEYCLSEVGRVYGASLRGTRQREDGSWQYVYTESNSCD